MKNTWFCILYFIFILSSFFLQSQGCSAPSSSAGSGLSTNTAGDFTIGVWMQSPYDAAAYKALGVNTYIGLWEWPAETNMGSNYNKNAAAALLAAGMKAYAGHDTYAVDWNNAHPEYASVFIGYMLGDEADMFKVNYNTSNGLKYEWALPDVWLTNTSNMKAADPARPAYANFGKPFAGGHYTPMSNSTRAADFAKYVAHTTVYSCDFYAMTDPYEAVSNHGIWKYGMACSNAASYAAGRPTWGFLEVSAPWRTNTTNQLNVRMRAEWVRPIVWNMVIHGARGIVYFCHDFWISNGLASRQDGCLYENGMPGAMSNVNHELLSYGAVLERPSLSGIGVTVTGAVGVVSMVKNHGGYIYIFAMGHGNHANIHGADVTARFTYPAQLNAPVEVLGENRVLNMNNGVFTDQFTPYQVHIYRFAAAQP